jgi:uncharacterized membrane protein YqjE
VTTGDQPRARENAFTLARRLVSGVVTLVRLEIQQGRQEVGERIGATTRGVMLFGIAAGFGLLALIALVALIIALLALLLPTWLAALIVLAAFLLLAVVFALWGKSRLRNPVPQDTIASVKEDVAWAKRLLRRG